MPVRTELHSGAGAGAETTLSCHFIAEFAVVACSSGDDGFTTM